VLIGSQAEKDERCDKGGRWPVRRVPYPWEKKTRSGGYGRFRQAHALKLSAVK
jgi:hypothetical protein